jgi:NAD(P)-dependent dehydrogenase (short-subunit alcohol dehydrogenase family)
VQLERLVESYRYPDVVKRVLADKLSLVTGASRGIGAATAVKLAEAGSDIVLNYRSKGARAEEVAARIAALGRRAIAVQADLTNSSELAAMMATVHKTFESLDFLILNASGGLEKGKAEDYAMLLNETAQLATARLAVELMPPGGRIVFVTSHWAHFYGAKPILPAYEIVAKSKRAGEDALRAYGDELVTRGISLVVVSGDAIEGTITPRLLERKSPGALNGRREANGLPTVDEFAGAIVAAALDPALPNGHTVFVGSTEW